MKKLALLYFTFLSISCFAQFSKTHYIPPLSGSDAIPAQEQYLYISTPSTTPVKVKINAIGVGITEITVSKNTPREYFIGFGTGTQLHVDPTLVNTPLSNKGYIIEAENLIYVAARVLAGNYNQAGSLVSKGISAIGNEFRVGAFINTATTNSATFRYTFLSILATENNTVVDFSGIKAGVTLVGNAAVGNTPPSVTLNRGQSYVLATEDVSAANKDGLIGALVKSNKPIVMNCGSYGGTNGEINGNLDLGFDQIVPAKIIGNEYIFVRGFGLDITERPLIVAHEDNTDVFINGSATPFNTVPLNAGQYLTLDGTNYSGNGSLYVRTSKNVFAFQSVGGIGTTGSPSQANQEMFFVPPLNCSTPNIVDNIPFIESIGSRSFTNNSGLNIVTEKGATVEISINGVIQPVGVPPLDVIGKPNFVSYTRTSLTGNIGVFSSKQVYVSFFGSSGAATYGGYYSGFDLKPEIITDKIAVTSTLCIPNIELKLNSLSSYDSFQWIFNDVNIPGATTNTYTPTQPGYYQVIGSISGCGSTALSDKIPVSICTPDLDSDGINDNIDIDNDNDGIINCTESYGNLGINTSNNASGTIAINNYTNSFTGTLSSNLPLTATSFTGKTNGDFTTEIPAGNGNSVSYQMNFTSPISVKLSYVSTANATDLLNSNSEFTLSSPTDKTITVLNPNNQLLIDTNYDGIFESDITEFSSFEIRFRLNSAVPLAAGSGTFSFQTYLTTALTLIQKNLSDTEINKASFSLVASCVPKDTDLDGIADQLDLDSDNDGILDTVEAQGSNTLISYSTTDANKDGLSDAFGTGLIPVDSDNDLVPDYIDVDSDNDGIYDLVESGSNQADANLDGKIDGSNFGLNGLANSIETTPDSGVLNYTIADTDSDGIKNYIEIDSDNDLCFDTIEAGFLDPNNDGQLGNSPITVDNFGKVTSASAYTAPNSNYITAAPIVITSQPSITPTCELQNTTVTVSDNGGNTYQWEISTNGTTWNSISNNATYNGATTNSLLITAVTNAMNGYSYRVQLNKVGNSCGLLSNEAKLTVYMLPVVNNITIVQCDDDANAITTFNLTIKNNEISSNYVSENFTYYTSFSGATTANSAELITTPTAYTNTTPSTMKVWSRVINSNGCFSVAELTLNVVATQIPASFIRTFTECDDFLDINGNNTTNNDKRDGIASFNFSSAETDIRASLPPGNYTVTFYRNQTDALAELNVITDISNYRNIGYPNTQDIWGRVDSDVDNACYGLGSYVLLTVESLPLANTVTVARQCDDNQDGIYTFDTSTLESDLLQGQSNITVTYFDKDNNSLTSPFPATFTTASQIIRAVVTNNTTLQCYDETMITFTVDDLPEAFAIDASLTTTCDDESDPLLQDGIFSFDTSTFQNTILGVQTGMAVSYYDANGALLPSPLPNPFMTTTQNITVVVENTINPSCSASVLISFVVNELPPIRLNTNGDENELVCTNLPTFFVTLEAGIQDGSSPNNYTYTWYKDNAVIAGETSPTLDVNTEGQYQVDVTTLLGCTRTRSIKVTASDIATITTIDINDLADINTVTVNVSGQGDYEYSIDEPTGPFQNSNFFGNVPAGLHEVYINDKNGCGTVSKSIAILGAPKFFTPNGDGFNDYWNIKGANTVLNSMSTIFIFDRYGKLLKQISPNSLGWNGTFNGYPLPSDDYWYTVKLEDGREVKGHFSLKR
jgi:gliding motility-associated-like protein